MAEVIEEAGRDLVYKKVAELVKERRDKNYVKSKLPTGHPAKQWVQEWDRLGYEEDQMSGNILLVLDATRICIPRGTDEDGKVDGSMRKKISKLLHIPHLGEIKTSRAAERFYFWPTMYNEIYQEVKDCEICLINSRSQAPEPPPQKHEFADYPMQKCSSDIFHFGADSWLILMDCTQDSALRRN